MNYVGDCSDAAFDILAAAKNNDVADMEEIIASGADIVSACNDNAQTGLHFATMYGHVEVSLLLLRAGAKVNAQNRFGATPLHCAAQGSYHELAKLLLEWGADTQLRASRGERPYEAAEDEAMRSLCGAPSLKVHEALERLSAASRLSPASFTVAAEELGLETLLADGVNLGEQDPDGNTALHLAVLAALGDPIGGCGHHDCGGECTHEPLEEEVVHDHDDRRLEPAPSATMSASLALLLRQPSVGRPLTQCNGAGLMPLHVAAARGSADVCESLLAAGAPVGACSTRRDEYNGGSWGKQAEEGLVRLSSTDDKTPLHFAVGLLLERCAAPSHPATRHRPAVRATAVGPRGPSTLHRPSLPKEPLKKEPYALRLSHPTLW